MSGLKRTEAVVRPSDVIGVSNHDKKWVPPTKQARTGSPGAEILLRASMQATAEKAERRFGDVIPSPVPYDQTELGSGRGITYEWEHWVKKLQTQINNLGGGSGGGGAEEVFQQSAAASVWSIPHSLGTYPNVLLIDGSGQELFAEVHYPSDSQVTVIHGSPYAGTAYLRA